MGIDTDNLVETVDELRFRESDEFDYYELNDEAISEKYKDGFNKACSEVVEILYSLPTQQDKVVVPQVADDHIKEGLTMGASKVEIICCAESYSTAIPNDEFSKWFRKNEDLFFLAVANGYTVEKEPLYEVVFYEDESDRWLLMQLWESSYEIVPESENDGYRTQWFSEKEIKAINEKYWVFRHPVEEE